MTGQPIGIYIHIPFCDGKCPYCDFYSVAPDADLCAHYIEAVEREMSAYDRLQADTVYFGGGTPTLMGSDGLSRLLDSTRDHFVIDSTAEITFEMNPRTADRDMLKALRSAGFNRVSLGVQSGVDEELEQLGRRHTIACAQQAVSDIRAAGFGNLSLDLMLGIPGQTPESLVRSIDAICSLEPEHISAYILKIEPGTPFEARYHQLELTDDDRQADLYEQAVTLLAQRGYKRYEISNFARPGFESRHNSRYWDCGEYLGFGPAAHSFRGGRRFFYPRDIAGFISAPATVEDGTGGTEEEYVMLRLRLADGLTQTGWQWRFGTDIPEKYYMRAQPLVRAGLLEADLKGIRLRGNGFLLSNSVISRLLDE